jgi:hypothetical protein
VLGLIVLEVGRESLKEIQAKAVKQTKDVGRVGNSAGECNEPDKRKTRRKCARAKISRFQLPCTWEVR